MVSKIGLLYFHQGWTDIVNCLALIDYYNNYDILYLLIRDDSYKLINYYIKNKSNVIPVFVQKNILDNTNPIQYFNNTRKIENYDILFHGMHDAYRIDNYKYVFSLNNFFVNSFYSAYDIDYINRVQSFNLERDYNIEDNIYEKFINKYGKKYILNHEIENIISEYPNINLNNYSDTFFDCIKILQNAKEIHLLDSIWGSIIYCLDAKYKLFKDIKIYIYCKRGYTKMFSEPVLLENWIFK
jgi:hypothetical protein